MVDHITLSFLLLHIIMAYSKDTFRDLNIYIFFSFLEHSNYIIKILKKLASFPKLIKPLVTLD